MSELHLMESRQGGLGWGNETLCQDSPQFCALGGASNVFTGIRGAGVLLHSSSGCAWITRWVRSDHVLASYAPVIASSLFEKDIIFGGKDKLKSSISWTLENWRLRLLCVINGCTGSLINDPVDAISAEMEKKYQVPIVFVDSAGFKGLSATGADDAFFALLKKLARDEVEKDGFTVNLIAPQLMGSSNWVYDLAEIRRLLERLDLKINCVLTHGTRIEEVEQFNRAATDIYLTYEVFPQLADYEDMHQIRRVGASLPLPVGVANTEEWYLGLATEFDKLDQAEEILKDERKQLKPLKYHYNGSWLTTWLSNKRAAVIGPATWAAAMARCLYFDFAVVPAVIGLFAETPEAFESARASLGELAGYCNPVIMDNPLYIQATDVVVKNSVEFAIGQTQEKSLLGSVGIPHLSLAGQQTVLGAFNFMPYPSMGLKGIPYLLTMFGRLLEESFHEPEKWQATRFKPREEWERLEEGTSGRLQEQL